MFSDPLWRVTSPQSVNVAAVICKLYIYTHTHTPLCEDGKRQRVRNARIYPHDWMSYYGYSWNSLTVDINPYFTYGFGKKISTRLLFYVLKTFYFLFRNCYSRKDLCDYPSAHIKLMNQNQFLMIGQKYKMIVNVELPESTVNEKIG